MTESQKQTKLNLIPKPIQRAFYASAGFSLISLPFIPVEHIWIVGTLIAGHSLLVTSWYDLSPKKSLGRRRKALLNGRTIDLEHSMSQGGYMARETWGELGKRLMFGKGEAKPPVKLTPPMPRPAELNEFIFISNGLQLRETHVKLFIKSAWRNRQYGKGLSERRWVREFSQRQAWYQELSTDWYYAIMKLLLNCQSTLGYQMITVKANSWLNLANEPFMTMRLLKWYEIERRQR